MSPNEELFRRVMQAFNRGYAGEPGTFRPRQAGKTAAGVQAVIDVMQAEAPKPDVVPGVMRCAKCQFQVYRTTLHINSGTTSAGDNKTEPCPNGCGPLWPISWEQYCWEALATSERFFEETRALKQSLAEIVAFPKEPTEAMEWAFHNGVRPGARNNFLNRYRAMRAALISELAAKPTGDTCTCPTCGDWYAAEDIDRMVKEISDALGSTATHPKLCDIVVETVRAIGGVPEAKVSESDDHPDAGLYIKGWNDCRDAMLAVRPEVQS